MNDLHQAYLSLGSNIDPEIHLPGAIGLLKEYGQVRAVSRAWQSHAVGSDGPDFLNACVLFLSHLPPYDLKEQIIRPIEARLGRVRYADKNAPRTIDLDILLFDETPLNIEFWAYAFVIIPLAELIPDFIHPVSGKKLASAAELLQSQVWIVPRKDVVIS
ncbi:MAG TPA: 2-amino-4-hydroxy-6-hydroxymethyldihydropteridine diphosphokinase [Anaerolineales bacterium]|nr:2-amino-4-hydroxy-6-hydroxymethyldihydropteridine diphosphokinase [Anaerolineales bacterium]